MVRSERRRLAVRDVSRMARVISDPRGRPATVAERSYTARRIQNRAFAAAAAGSMARGDDMSYVREHSARQPRMIAFG